MRWFEGRLPDEEFWPQVAPGDAELRSSFESTVTFGVNNWSGPVWVGEWELHNGTRSLVYANAADNALLVVYTVEDRDPRNFVMHLRWGQLATMNQKYAEFIEGDVFHEVPDDVLVLDIDRVPVVFETWTDESDMWGAGVLGNHTIAFRCSHLIGGSPALTRVQDIDPYIEGRHNWIRRARTNTGGR